MADSDADKVKDSYYDPKQFRSDRPGVPPPPARATPRRPFTLGHLVLGLLAVIALVAGLEALRDRPRDVMPPAAPVAALPACDAGRLPVDGGIRVFEPARMRRTDALFSGLRIVNGHRYDIVAVLTDRGGGQPLLGLAIPSGRTVEVGVPVGRYGLRFFSGTTWCNDTVGFQDGRQVNLQGGIEVAAGTTAILTLAPDGPAGPERFTVTQDHRQPRAEGPPPEQTGPGYVNLRQRADGHYHVAGSVNGTSLEFILDTGATLTALSEDMASRAGLDICTPRAFNTANGTVQGCVARARELAFGGFVLHDTEVAIMPGLADSALLGMNVLRQFRVEQRDGALRIAIR